MDCLIGWNWLKLSDNLEGFFMKEKAMDTKLVLRPIVGYLTHSHFWEGPCRAGHKEDMTQEARAGLRTPHFITQKKK